MPRRWREAELLPELRTENGRRLQAAVLNWQVGRLRVIEEVLRKRHPAMGFVDATVFLHIFVMRKRGTRQQQLVESIPAPRRSIRTVLERLEAAGMICRDGEGPYYPTRDGAAAVNEIFPITQRYLRRLCVAYRDYDTNWPL